MISRRNFLKIAGLSTVALGAGFTTGKLIGNKKPVHFAIHGFIPADEKVIGQLVAAFKNKVKCNSKPIVIADYNIGESIKKLDQKLTNRSFSNSGTITYRLKKLEKQIESDIVISDSNNPVYSLNDLDFGFSNIRSGLKRRKAEYFFTAEYKQTDFLSSFFNSNKNEIVIENEKGIAERFSQDKNYENILIDGPQGKTGIKIENGVARIHTSTCRNGICKHSFASETGNLIVCAPNRILVKVETV